MRQIIISAIGLLIIAAGYFGRIHMASAEKPEPKKETQAIPAVYTEVVKNSNSPIKVTASGNLSLIHISEPTRPY